MTALTKKQTTEVETAIGRALKADIAVFRKRAREAYDAIWRCNLEYAPYTDKSSPLYVLRCATSTEFTTTQLVAALKQCRQTYRLWVNPPARLSDNQAPAWLVAARTAA